VRRFGDAWVAVADLAGTPEIVAARRLDLALVLALWPLGSGIAAELALDALAASSDHARP
jgi:hypothetical protein